MIETYSRKSKYDISNFCLKCMHEKEDADSTCLNCGFDNTKYKCADDVLPPGTVLNERYLIGSVMFQSGLGITYAAYDSRISAAVAIKELYIHNVTYRSNGIKVVTTEEAKEKFVKYKDRFSTEAKILAMINAKDKESIFRILDRFEENGTDYIVTEYIDGITLNEYVRSKESLSVPETRKIIDSISHILQKIHEFGTGHYDVCPENIIVEENGDVKLMDFGRETGMGRDCDVEYITSRSGYIPPELYSESGNIGTWSDTYSVAATMYYCLTGRKPTDAHDRENGIELPMMARKGLRINKETENIVSTAMSMNPSERYQSVERFHETIPVKKEIDKRVLIGGIVGIVSLIAIAIILIVTNSCSGKKSFEQGEIMEFTPGTYIFENYENPDCIMGIDGGFCDDGSLLTLKDYEDANKNRLIVTESGGSQYNLQAAHTNSYICAVEVQDVGTQLVQNALADGTAPENYRFIYCGKENDKDVVIILSSNGMALSPADNATVGGTPIVLSEYNIDSNPQKWYVRWSEKDESETDKIVYHEGDLVESMIGTHTMASALDGNTMCAISRYEGLPAPQLIVWENVWDVTQQFDFSLQEESRYRIFPKDQINGESKCLEYDPVTGSVFMRDVSESTNQLFRVVYAGYGMYLIQTYDERIIGFEPNADGSVNGRPIVAKMYEEYADTRTMKWLIQDPQ